MDDAVAVPPCHVMAADLLRHYGIGASTTKRVGLAGTTLQRVAGDPAGDITPRTHLRIRNAWWTLPAESRSDDLSNGLAPEQLAAESHVRVLHESDRSRVTTTESGGFLIAGPVLSSWDRFSDAPGETRMSVASLPADVDPAALASVIDELFGRTQNA